MAQEPTTRNAITRLLTEFGPMTADEIACELGMHLKTVASAICIARKKPEKYFYVYAYDFQPGSNAVPAIYAAGKKPDAKRMEKALVSRLYYERTKHGKKILRQVQAGNPFGILIAQVTQ
ncbi:sigma-70 region 4 domain-containing protein [Paraburkholderia dilworthii]|uniref:sigma-70 region 4 domain-containing protein n=1 Tax=Paraburkholderia dilworthii TaxID=948106 RepID=UPI000488DDED|nr:sigma-70 region 4 domain-containing protein [Paraburkholderia dilworthii]